MRALAVVALFLVGAGAARADGCYICEGGSYVKFAGEDSWAKRHKAEACGCKVLGNTSKCGGDARHKVLCEVAKGDAPTGARTARR
jgi:hypothetical protein